MGPVARLVVHTGLLILKWLLWIAGGLLIVLVVVQYFRADAFANPGGNLTIAAALLIVGLVCDFAGRKVKDG